MSQETRQKLWMAVQEETTRMLPQIREVQDNGGMAQVITSFCMNALRALGELAESMVDVPDEGKTADAGALIGIAGMSMATLQVIADADGTHLHPRGG